MLKKQNFIVIVFNSRLFFSSLSYGSQKNLPITNVEKCQTLESVRAHIDTIDQTIVNLIAQRLLYVKQAGEIKSGHKPLQDKSRETKILHTVGQQAQRQGYSSDIAIFKVILEQSKNYEHNYYHSQRL